MSIQEILCEAQALSTQEQIQLAAQLLQSVQEKTNLSIESKKQRVPGLHRDSCIVSDDFDEPLSDNFWIGEV
ncbi:hypothetical protein IQ218_15105 [Synechocystis salina LEGE 06099]|uniref:hypothetical protein n=1 Tax=Synechocystis salina TaxID=945780 RepID=UPI0018804FC4|nr:hypothetical protein [Synechocystis salina]MBE9204526.1 hypothetical protein [Synechocystis salina LEGE 06099]